MSPESFQAPELKDLSGLLPSLEFHSFIAKGGMGAVYRARQRSLDRDVAVKVLPRELGADPEFHACFETEAKAMARFNHPNLISVYDFGDIDGMPFIVMEYVDGKSLYHSAWNKRIDPRQAVEIVAGICRGLSHAHENGVIHRDIKPANILLTPKAEPKIGDFGLARPADYDGPQLVMGTPGYTAPEFLSNPEQSDARADLYAVGVILHELVTGKQPDKSGKSPSKPTGNLRLDAIWRKATQPDPNRRYSTAKEMAEALEGWLKNPGPNTAGPPPSSAPAGTSKSPLTPGQSAGPSKALPTPLSVGKAPQPSASDATTPPIGTPTGSNWALIRNLLIIATLLVAIGFAYKAYDQKKKKIAKQEEQNDRERYEKQLQAEREARQRADDQARRLAEEKARELAARNAAENLPPEPKVETPLETLERLRFDLAGGGRAEMPKGTIRKGNRDLFIVKKPLSWHQATAFAEAHGGHLAIVNTVDDISWFTEILPRDTIAWLGAGRTVGDRWLNVDGSDWALDRKPPGAGNFAAIDDLGLLRARRRSERYPFIIQWDRDGSNAATLAAMLRRTRETLDTPSPAYPPGTEAQDARHFALIPRSITRREATELARQAGGTLAVPATKPEADWLEARADELGEISGGLWLGGTRRNDLWTWDSGEPWSFARWSDGTDPTDEGSGIILAPGLGWQTLDPDAQAAGFIIEWSNDGADLETRPEEMNSVHAGLSELQKKAGELVAQAMRERDDKLSANARTLAWDLDVWLRGLSSRDRARHGPHVEAVKKMIVNNRVPAPADFATSGGSTVGEKPQIQLTEAMAKACQYAQSKQLKIDQAHLGKLRQIRDAYVKRLQAAEAEADRKGQRALANTIAGAITAAGDLDDWAAQLTP